MNFKAILFDLGGTLTTRDVEDRLIDEKALELLAKYLLSKGCSISLASLTKQYWDNYLTINDLREHFMIEIPMRAWLSRLIHKLLINNSANDIIDFAENALIKERVDTAVTFPDISIILELLSSKYRLGIVSNSSSDKVTNGILRHLDLSKFFDCVITSAEFGVRKPYSGIFLYALREMGLNTSDVIFIGDSYKHDIVGSFNAKIKCCLINDDVRISHKIPKPDVIVNSLSEFQKLMT